MPLLQGILTGTGTKAQEKRYHLVHSRFRHFREDRTQASHGEEVAEEEMFETLEAIRGIAEAEQIPMGPTCDCLGDGKAPVSRACSSAPEMSMN